MLENDIGNDDEVEEQSPVVMEVDDTNNTDHDHQEEPTFLVQLEQLFIAEMGKSKKQLKWKPLPENTGTNKVKSVMIKLPEPDELHLTSKSFSGMTNLGIFINLNASLYGEVGFLPNKLRIIDWGNCELQSLPSNLLLNELVVFNMPNSRFRQLGERFKNLSKLTSLNLRGCQFLTKIPDLSGSPNLNLPAYLTKFVNLEILCLVGCTKLLEIPELPPKVRVVWAIDCSALENFAKLLSLFEHESVSHGLESLKLIDCPRLCANNGYELARMEFVLLNQHSNDFEIVVPGSEVLKWFDYRCEEAENLILEPDILNYSAVICEVSIKIPRNVEWQKSGLAVCVVFERTESTHGTCEIGISGCSHVFDSVSTSVKSCAVHLVCQQIEDVMLENDSDIGNDFWSGYIGSDDEMEGQSTNPTNPQQKRPPGASLVMEVDDTNNTDHDHQEEPTFSGLCDCCRIQ
ncbi:hypothetical protein M0R45_014486 [Rubus argutus]|uniref:Leucine-rich repeat domain, L domain-containing protein n=1 Tax=Rubus argutus TaxID=59490 RepID=A0AAW1XMX5_RUBAR